MCRLLERLGAGVGAITRFPTTGSFHSAFAKRERVYLTQKERLIDMVGRLFPVERFHDEGFQHFHMGILRTRLL